MLWNYESWECGFESAGLEYIGPQSGGSLLPSSSDRAQSGRGGQTCVHVQRGDAHTCWAACKHTCKCTMRSGFWTLNRLSPNCGALRLRDFMPDSIWLLVVAGLIPCGTLWGIAYSQGGRWPGCPQRTGPGWVGMQGKVAPTAT